MWHHPKYYEEMKRKRKELERQATSNKQEGESKDEHQASSDKRQASEQEAIKIHEAWCLENGYLKPQATSVKLPGSRYKSSDYSKRATNCRSDDMTQESCKRQAASTRNPDSSSKRQAPSSDKNFSMSLNPDSLGSSFRPPATRSRIQEPS
jgi:hypothetical protein